MEQNLKYYEKVLCLLLQINRKRVSAYLNLKKKCKDLYTS